MKLRDERWYPAACGLLLLAVWLTAAAVFEFPSWQFGLLAGVLNGGTLAWSENLRRERRLRGQREEDMGYDYRA